MMHTVLFSELHNRAGHHRPAQCYSGIIEEASRAVSPSSRKYPSLSYDLVKPLFREM